MVNLALPGDANIFHCGRLCKCRISRKREEKGCGLLWLAGRQAEQAGRAATCPRDRVDRIGDCDAFARRETGGDQVHFVVGVCSNLVLSDLYHYCDPRPTGLPILATTRVRFVLGFCCSCCAYRFSLLRAGHALAWHNKLLVCLACGAPARFRMARRQNGQDSDFARLFCDWPAGTVPAYIQGPLSIGHGGLAG